MSTGAHTVGVPPDGDGAGVDFAVTPTWDSVPAADERAAP
ncbi:hypothetical protein EES41_30010 [Streptomyces sp. ADI95-16]|nr:hypothetical protein EES41_30010 [Streptomyces sp. ADI95-16]